jgi:hypothetical protein
MRAALASFCTRRPITAWLAILKWVFTKTAWPTLALLALSGIAFLLSAGGVNAAIVRSWCRAYIGCF